MGGAIQTTCGANLTKHTRTEKGLSIHLRKIAEEQIQDAQNTPTLPSLEFQEQEITNIMSDESSTDVGKLAAMTVVAAGLLESARRTDPAIVLQRRGGDVASEDNGESARVPEAQSA